MQFFKIRFTTNSIQKYFCAMCEYSSLRVLLVLFMMSFVLVKSILTGTCVPQTILNPFDLINLQLLPISDVPPCKGCEEDLFATEFLTSIQNSRIDPLAKSNSDKEIALCDVLKFLGEKGKCGDCDLSYVVVIMANAGGKKVITGQGLRMMDGTILTPYSAIQYGTEIEVLFPCGATKRAKCISHLKKCCKNVLSYLYTVKLVLENGFTSCCRNEPQDCCCMKQGKDCCCTMEDSFAEPRFEACKTSFPISGCLVAPINSSCTSNGPKTVWSYYLNDLTGLAESLAFPEDAKELGGSPATGSVFINDDCKIIGMAVAKPKSVTGTTSAIPLLNQVNTKCVVLIMPIEW